MVQPTGNVTKKTKTRKATLKKAPAVPSVLDLVATAKPAEPEPPPPIGLVASAIDAADDQAGINVAHDDPHRLARLHLRLAHHHPERPTLACQGGGYLAWDGRLWVDVSGDVDQALVRTTRMEFERQNRLAVAAADAQPAAKGGKPPSVRKIDTRLIGNIRLALRSLVAVPTVQERPCWLGGKAPWPAREVMAFPNALVHLPGLAAGVAEYRAAPTPQFFSTRCMGFNFDPSPPPPALWLAFLAQILGDDQEAVELLQEWFGYCLADDTSQQKILMIIGPTRSGKGTIGRVLGGLLGPEGSVGTGFTNLATNFGLQSLIGKAAAILGDARLSWRIDQGTIVERLLSISGEDEITVDRKHLHPWTGKLPTRLVLLSNELPELKDASQALANRLLMVQLEKSFLDKEDPALTAKLLVERPGILHWAVAGWMRLQKRGHFVQPQSGEPVLAAMKHLSSPVAAFVEDCCVVDPARKVRTEALYKAYQAWCQPKGQKPSDSARFGKNLAAAVPGIKNQRISVEKAKKKIKVPYYLGIALKSGAVSVQPGGVGTG